MQNPWKKKLLKSLRVIENRVANFNSNKSILIIYFLLVSSVSGELLIHFDFEKFSGRKVFDVSSGNSSISGELMTTASILKDSGGNNKKESKVLLLDQPGDYFKVDNPSVLKKAKDNITIALWFRGRAVTQFQTFISLSNSWSLISTTPRNITNFECRLQGRYTLESTNATGAEKPFLWKSNDGGWHHMAAVYSRSKGEVKFYIDGKPYLTGKTNSAPLPKVDGALLIGAALINGKAERFHFGAIDDVRIYSTAFSDEQVRALYNPAATSPLPVNAVNNISPQKLALKWTPGPVATAQKVLMGKSPGNLKVIANLKGNVKFINLKKLSWMQRYFWRVDTYSNGSVHQGETWSFTTQSKRAEYPIPKHLETGVINTGLLRWTPSQGAGEQRVYFGEENDSLKLIRTLSGNADSCELPYTLNGEKKYAWRVDTLRGTQIIAGKKWQFTSRAKNGRTILLIGGLGEKSSAEDEVYLASLAASVKANNSEMPVVVGLTEGMADSPELIDFINRYKPSEIYELRQPKLKARQNVFASSLNFNSVDEAVSLLAGKFWSQSDFIVLSKKNQYGNSLNASTLAGRLKAPLFYYSGKEGLTKKTLQSVKSLKPQKVLIIGDQPEVLSSQLNSFEKVNLDTDDDIIDWMVARGMKIDYVAAANPLDKTFGMTRKSSLIAPALAIARKGIVAQLPFESIYQKRFERKATVSKRPHGAPLGTYELSEKVISRYNRIVPPKLAPGFNKPVYKVFGFMTIYINGTTVTFCADASDASQYNRLLIDLDKSGDFSNKEYFSVGDSFTLTDVSKGVKEPQRYKISAIGGNYKGHSGQAKFRAELSSLNWMIGKCELQGRQYDYVMTPNGSSLLKGIPSLYALDLNGNGRFDDDGEGPHYPNNDPLVCNGRKYGVNLGDFKKYIFNDIRFTYPTVSEMNGVLSKTYKKIGRVPTYLCLVGLYDVLPMGVCDSQKMGMNYPTDMRFGNIDEDPFQEISVGRFVSEGPGWNTLQAARTITYNDLVDESWANEAIRLGAWPDPENEARLNNIGIELLGASPENFSQDLLRNKGVILLKDHGTPFGAGGLPEPGTFKVVLAPAIVDSGTPCMSAGIDLGHGGCQIDVPDPGHYVVMRTLRKGAVAFWGHVRSPFVARNTGRDLFWEGIVHQDLTIGEAFKLGTNGMLYTWLTGSRGGKISYSSKTYYLMSRMRILYGDPALKPYLPHKPLKKAAHVKVTGNNVRVKGPQSWPTPFTGLGTYGEPLEPGNHLVKIITQYPVREIVEVTELPDSRLGWPINGKSDDRQRAWILDPNPDGTYTVWWRCRFEQLSGKGRKSKLLHRVNQIEYNFTESIQNNSK